ncbi:MAG: hypothetical protein JXB33_11135 [Clostridia bacterium]|nr:hypothetical protein [Clostridia bacterium]
MGIWEKVVFFSGGAFIFLYPAVIIAFAGRFILLSIFFAYVLAGFYLMHRFMCRKCMNFACPLNAADERAKEEFKKRNPGT